MEMTEQQSRQRRDLIALALGISVFYLAGGDLAEEALIFWAVTISHPVALKLLAALIFSWFFYRYELYVGREGRSKLSKFMGGQMGGSPAVDKFRSAEALADHTKQWILKNFGDLKEGDPDLLSRAFLTKWQQELESKTRVDVRWGWVTVAPTPQTLDVGKKSYTVAPRIRIGFWCWLSASGFMVKQVLFRDSQFSDYAVPYLLAFFAVGLTIWFELAAL